MKWFCSFHGNERDAESRTTNTSANADKLLHDKWSICKNAALLRDAEIFPIERVTSKKSRRRKHGTSVCLWMYIRQTRRGTFTRYIRALTNVFARVCCWFVDRDFVWISTNRQWRVACNVSRNRLVFNLDHTPADAVISSTAHQIPSLSSSSFQRVSHRIRSIRGTYTKTVWPKTYCVQCVQRRRILIKIILYVQLIPLLKIDIRQYL